VATDHDGIIVNTMSSDADCSESIKSDYVVIQPSLLDRLRSLTCEDSVDYVRSTTSPILEKSGHPTKHSMLCTYPSHGW